MGRRSLWPDARLRALTGSFVPVGDEDYRLKTGDGADCALFRAFAERGHYGGPDSTSRSRQGIYAITPRGDLLASCNSHDPGVVADMLERGLARWAELPASQQSLDDRTRSALRRAPHPRDAHPPGGLVLDVTSRDLPRSDAPDDWRAHAFNLGQVWFTRDEARKLVSHRTPRAPPYVVLPPIADRLARFHLLDNVRGNAVPFGRRQIERASLTSTVIITVARLE